MAQDLTCVSGDCRVCTPSGVECQEDEYVRCKVDGSGYEVLDTCVGDEQCTVAGCVDLCERAAEQRSYIGCEYWPVTTANAGLNRAFTPALAVGNPNLQAVEVTLDYAGEQTRAKVRPGDVEVLELPFNETLKTPYEPSTEEEGRDHDFLDPRSLLVRGGAARLVSTAPVTVHQFNPLEFETQECDTGREDAPGDRGCFSHTNDASLLLPTTALTGDYMAITRPPLVLHPEDPDELAYPRAEVPGFVAIVGTQSEPTRVEIRTRAYVAATSSASEARFGPFAPGDVFEVQLSAGDVLQLVSAATPEECPGTVRSGEVDGQPARFCDPGRDYDLTGTEIKAEAPVSVIAGHDCAYVPFDRQACDHLEETMFPLESWGEQVVVTRPRREGSERYRVKVLSAVDGNRLRVEPGLDEEVILDRGESFEWESEQHMLIRGDAPIAVAQFLQGQGSGDGEVGDPSMSLAIPRDQFKREYAILRPATFPEVYVNIVVPTGLGATLDGADVGGLTPIGDSGLSVARRRISTPGLHVVKGLSPVGVVVYGFARYTSYMVPGGLDLTLLHPSPI